MSKTTEDKTANNRFIEFFKRYKKLLIVSTIVILIISLGLYGYTTFTHNLAKDVAEPIEKSLVQAGAVKKCEGGDAGRGVDNQSPYYGATFIINKNTIETESIINKVFADNGYKLTHASPDNRGFLNSVADEYINKWYFDGTSKNSTFGNLKSGPIKVTATINGAGSSNDCTHETIPNGQSTIGIGVFLPEFK